MKTVYVLVGNIASGKSTYIKTLVLDSLKMILENTSVILKV